MLKNSHVINIFEIDAFEKYTTHELMNVSHTFETYLFENTSNSSHTLETVLWYDFKKY